MAEGGSSIAKYGKILSLVSVLGAGGAAGYGYKAENRGVQRLQSTMQARVRKVWDLLSDPASTPRWMPQEVLDIEKVESLGPKGLDKIGAFFTGDGEPKAGEPTHVFHLRDGRKLKARVVLEEDEKVYRESVTILEGELDPYIESAEWGFEVVRNDESRRETDVTLIRKMRYKRPIGVLRELLNRAKGKRAEEDQRIFQGIERAARDV